MLSNFFSQIISPVATSIAYSSSEMPAKIASSRAPRAVVTPDTVSGANRLCICRGVLLTLIFHSSFIEPTLAVVKTFSFFNHPVRPLSTPSVR